MRKIMPTFGTLVRSAPIRVSFSATNNGQARGGVTMYFLKPGRIVDIQEFTGIVPPFEMTLPRATTRLVLEANPSANGGTVSVDLEQSPSNVRVIESVQVDTPFVFDVA